MIWLAVRTWRLRGETPGDGKDMAKIFNRSSHDIEVYGLVAGTPKRWILPAPASGATIATLNAFDCTAVRAPSWTLTDIFDSEDWWEVLTDEVYIYDFGLWDTSLHCVPPVAGQRGYKPYDSSLITIPLDDALTMTEPGPPPGPRDGELDSTHPRFGKFVRTGKYISVRIKPHRSPYVKQDDLDDQLAIWKAKIESIWNDAAVPMTSTGTKLVFECDWVDANSHYRIVVFETTERASMYHWSLDMDDEPDPTGVSSGVDNLITCAHEFGHYLGLDDGYLYSFELPYLENAAFMKDSRLKGKKLTLDGFFNNLWSKYPLYEARANERINNGECQTQIDMMTRGNFIFTNAAPRPNPRIPQDQIEIIDQLDSTKEHKTQSLCWRVEHFRKA